MSVPSWSIFAKTVFRRISFFLRSICGEVDVVHGLLIGSQCSLCWDVSSERPRETFQNTSSDLPGEILLSEDDAGELSPTS